MSALVLIADADPQRGKQIAEACSGRGLACSLTTSGPQALEAALTELPAALIAQLALPLIDGPRLVAILAANPRTHGMAVLLLADREGEGASAQGDGPVISPPCDPEGVARRVQILLAERASARSAPREATAAGGVEGQLGQLPLADLLELFHGSRKTGVVKLVRRDARGRTNQGRVWLRDGEVLQAEVDRVEGEKALYRLLAWDRGSFCFTPRPVAEAQVVRAPTRALLREGMRQIRESERLAGDLPARAAEVRLVVRRAALPNVIHPLTQEVLLVLEHYSRVQDIVDHCSFPDYRVLRTLHTLIARGMVELREPGAPEARRAPTGLLPESCVARLRDGLEAPRAPGASPRDAKIAVISADRRATQGFARLLHPLPGMELDARFAQGGFSPEELAPLGRLRLDAELAIELVHVPADERFAPLWPLVGDRALGVLLLLCEPIATAADAVRQAEAELGQLPRARFFHVVLLEKGERVTRDVLREKLALLAEGSTFLLPLDHRERAGTVLREMFARVLP